AVSAKIVAYYTGRRQRAVSGDALTEFRDFPLSTIWGISPSFSFSLPQGWSARIVGYAGQDTIDNNENRFAIATGVPGLQIRRSFRNRSSSLSLETEGPLFKLPGGVARAALGG